MENRKKWILDGVLLLLITAMTLFAILHGQDLSGLLIAFRLSNSWYWLAALLCVFPFVFSESLILYLLLRHVGAEVNAKHCLIYSAIGFFFSCITPAAGGGQPAQLYYMHKDGLSPGTTAPILLVVTIFYKLVLVIAGLLLLIIRPVALLFIDPAVIWWAFAGWVVNVVVVTFFILLVAYPAPMERIAFAILQWLAAHKIRPEKVERWKSKLERTFVRYREASHYIRNNLKLLAVVFLISVVQRTILFSITWLVMRSFRILNSVSGLEIILLQSMVALGTDMIPLPGGSGANEAMFLMLFGDLCGEEFAIPLLIASRGISYYGQILICGLIFLIFARFIGKKAADTLTNHQTKNSSQT